MPIAVVSGAMANKLRKGGEAWVRLSYVRGIQRLGFDVYFIEEISSDSCVGNDGLPASFKTSANREYFQSVMNQFGLDHRSALICDGGKDVHGLTIRELLEIAGEAAILINITGHLQLDAIKCRFRRRAYIDIDPGYTQFWHAAGDPGPRLAGHDCYFTIGENIGLPHCSIPTVDIAWTPTRPPVVLEDWPLALGAQLHRFTTVASWRGGYGPIEFDGRAFGVKAHEFRRFLDLPARARHRFEIALDIHPGDRKDLDQLFAHGWTIRDPVIEAGDPCRFRSYVQESDAEFSVAQSIYAETHSGWFSDRTVRYLASGKPALIQDTGVTGRYPTDGGLVVFRTMAEAVRGADEIACNYAIHAARARAIAQEYFDSDRVLGNLLDVASVPT